MTFGILLEAIILPAICVVWLVGRASDNERAALRQASTDLQQRESVLVREQLLQSVALLSERLDLWETSDPFPEIGWVISGDLEAFEGKSFLKEADPLALSYLDQLRYLEQTMGPSAAIEQVRYWFREGSLLGLHLSGGRELEGALLLWAMELQGEGSDEFAVALHHYLVKEPGRRVQGSSFRVFLVKQLLERHPEFLDLLEVVVGENAAIEFMGGHPEIPTESAAQFIISEGWIYRSLNGKGIETSDHLWFCRTIEFRTWLLETIGVQSRFESNRFELLEPGQLVTNPNSLQITIDMGGALKGWRLLSQLDESKILDPARQRVVIYVWVGILTTAASILFAVIGMGLVKSEITLARLKNDLAATVSHELKTPIASVRILVDTLLDGDQQLDSKTGEYLQLIRSENLRLGLLVEKFLTFSKMERGLRFLQMESVSASAIVEEACKIFRERFSAGDYTLDVHSGESDDMISADFQTLLSAVGNLLENAYKYSKDGRKIEVRVSSGEGEVCIEVQDNGEGIAPDEQKRIFRKFYQPDRRLNNHRGGVGLGLSIVAYVVKQHRGRVELESEPGIGSLFRIILPHA